MNIIRTIRYRVRWLRWFLTGPNTAMGVLRGWNKPTRDIIFTRWLEQEPRRDSTLPVGHPPVFCMRQDPLIRKDKP